MTCVVSEEDLLLACIKFRFLSSPLLSFTHHKTLAARLSPAVTRPRAAAGQGGVHVLTKRGFNHGAALRASARRPHIKSM